MNFNRTRTEDRADPSRTEGEETATTTDGRTAAEARTGAGADAGTDDRSTTEGSTGTDGRSAAEGRTEAPRTAAEQANEPRRPATAPAAPTAAATPVRPASTPGSGADRDEDRAADGAVKRPAGPAAATVAGTRDPQRPAADETLRDGDIRRERGDGVSGDTAKDGTGARSAKDSRTESAAPRSTTAAAPTSSAAEGREAGHGDTSGSGSATADIDQLSRRMERAVGSFVDDPRRAVREADAVLDEAARRLTRMVEERRNSLRDSWHGDNGDKTGTEELRVALTRYRDMTRELLNVG